MLLPANRQNNNERTKTPRKRVSLLPFVLPLKRCHRNSLPSSCIVQTRLLFFFSFQILSVGRFFFFLKPLKKAPSRVMERVESFAFLCKRENKRKKKFVIFDCETTTTTTTTTSCHRRRRRQRRRRHEHHHQQKRRNAKRDRRRLLLKRRRRKQKKKKMVMLQLLRRRNKRL